VSEYPPKYAVVNVVGCIKGKSATQVARTLVAERRNFTAKTFGHAVSYFVSTVGLGENMFRAYIRNQEEEDERYEQMKFGIYARRLGRLMLLWHL
jgi:putative transposase